MKNYPSRRQFLTRTASFLTTILASNYLRPSLAQTSEPTLEVYLILWRSYGQNIPWNSSSPKEVAEKAAFMIWSYIQPEIYGRANLLLDPSRLSIFLHSLCTKGSIIGHAALFARFRNSDEPWQGLHFSNTGDNVGFHHRWINRNGRFDPFQVNHRFPKRPPYTNSLLSNGKAPILICCYPLEVLAGHLPGRWETIDEFRQRLQTRRQPRMSKKVLTGTKAQETFALLQEIKTQTTATNGPGGPVDYGLNTKEVRTISNFNYPLPMKTYKIGGQEYPIWGGCANAVASVLQAANLSSMIEEKASFKIQLDYYRFRDAVIPILIGSQAFNKHTGTTEDYDLLSELERLPQHWGTGNTVEFYDPNYWYDSLPTN